MTISVSPVAAKALRQGTAVHFDVSCAIHSHKDTEHCSGTTL